MSSNLSTIQRRSRRQPRESSSSEEIETIDLNIIPSPTTTIPISSMEQVRIKRFIRHNILISQETENIQESPLVKIIQRKRRKDW
jgi:hypothetical protein